jgi:5'-nucleotidase
MNILLTNDDGCDAPGLASAFDALAELGTVHIVAPKAEQSACSHTISLYRPITVEAMTRERFGRIHSVDGTPADCVRLAVAKLLDGPIDLVVAGINLGANAGVDTFYSGTIAGAREAAMLGIPAIAVSQAVRSKVETDWAAASRVTADLVRELHREALPGPGFWSINLPAPIPPEPHKHVHRVPIATEPVLPGFEHIDSVDGRVQRFGYERGYWGREVSEPTDYSVVRAGGIAVSPVPLWGSFQES